MKISFEDFINEQQSKKYHVIESKFAYSTYRDILFTGTYDECETAIDLFLEDDRNLRLEIIPAYEAPSSNEKFNVNQNVLNITEPYDTIKKININGRNIYILFGDVDYYSNRSSILAIKGRSSKLKVDPESYENFLMEFKKRFNNIPELKSSDLIASIETTAHVNSDIMKIMGLPYVMDGFKKVDPSFKMKNVKSKDRVKITDVFIRNFDANDNDSICVLDDFITTGTSFKNAFDKIPPNINVVGACLFKLSKVDWKF